MPRRQQKNRRTPKTPPERKHAPEDLRWLVKMSGRLPREIADDMGLSSGTIYNWMAGRTVPSDWHYPELAAALAVTVDRLERAIDNTLSP